MRLLLERRPVGVPYEETRVGGLRVGAHLLDPEKGLHGSEGKHGEDQQDQRGAGQQRPGLALAHVADAEGKGRAQGARAPHVGGLDAVGVLPDLPHGLAEPLGDEPDDHGGEYEGHEGEEDDVGRRGDLEGRVGEAQHPVRCEEDAGRGADALVDIGETEEQPLEGVGEGDHQHHVEKHALHDVVGGSRRVGVGPGLVSPRGPGVLDEPVPLQGLPGCFGQVQQAARLAVEIVQPGVVDADGPERADPRFVQVPHVARHLVGSQRDGADPRLEADPLGVRFVGIGQDQAAAEQAGGHGDHEPAVGRREDDGRVLLVRKARGPAGFLEGYAPFQGRIARFVQHHGLVEPRQKTGVHQVVEVGRVGPEDHRGFLLVHPVHRDFERVGAFAVGTPVRRVDDFPRLGVHDEAFRRVGPARLQRGALGHAGAVGHDEDLVLHPADGLVVAAEADHGPGLGLARDVVFPGIEFDHPDAAPHEPVFELHLEIRKEHGVADGPAEQFREQNGLGVHVADIHPVDFVEGGVHVLPHVENGGEGKGGEPRPEDQFRVEGDVARGEELRAQDALGRRDDVHQRVVREEAAPDHFVRVPHEGTAEGREEPLFLEGVPGEEDACVGDPDLVPGAGEIDAGEELHVDRFFELIREIGRLARMAIREVVHAAQGQEMSRGRQEIHGAGRRVGGEVPGDLQKRGHARGLVRAGRHRRHGRHGVVVGLEYDDFVLEDRVGARDLAQDVVGGKAFPRHAALCPDGQGAVFFKVCDEGPGLFLRHPEPGEVHRDLEVLLLAVHPRGVVGFHEDHGAGAELGGPLPVDAGIEIHQEDGAGGIDAVEVLPFAVAHVVQLSGDPARRRRGGADQVGPHGVYGDRPGCQGRVVEDGQFAALVMGDGGDELLQFHVFQAHLPHAAGQVVGRFGGARVAGHPRAEGHQVGDGLPDPHRIDHGGHLAVADGFGQVRHALADARRLARGGREQCEQQDQAGKSGRKGSFKVQVIFSAGWV